MLKSPKENLKANFASFWRMYTLFFLGTFFIVFFAFIFGGRSFIWRNDASGQYMPNLSEIYGNISDALRSFLHGKYDGLVTYSFHAGIGSEISQNYCKGILEYLGFFLRRSNLEITFTVIIALRLYFAGISFGLMSMYFKNRSVYTVPGSILYVFNGFTMYYGMRHVTFLIPMVMLPLMIVGLDLIQKRKTPVLFIFTIAYSGWNGYYFLYMNTIFVAIYVIVTWIAGKQKIKDCWSDFWRVVMYYIVGASVAAVSLFPRLERFFLSTRSMTTTKESGSLLFYGKEWFGRLLVRLFSPYTTSEYTKHYMLYAVTPLIVIAVISLFLVKRSEKEKKGIKMLKIFVITGVVFLCVPIFAFVFSGFSSQVNRWNYAFVLVLSYILTKTLPHIFNQSSKTAIGALGVVVVWGIVLLVDKDATDLSTVLGLGLLILVILLYLGMSIVFRKKVEWRKWAPISATVLTALSAGFLGQALFNEKCGDFASQFLKFGEWRNGCEESLYYAAQAIDDPSFYRVEVDKVSQSVANSPKVLGVNGTSLYDSATNENNLCFSDELLDVDQLTSGNFYGYDSRFPLESLAGVKYYITSEENKNVPFGFRYLNMVTTPSGSEQWIYISKLPVSLGRVFTSFATEKEVESYSALQKQEMMLDTVILSQGEHSASLPDVRSYPIKKLNIRKKTAKNGTVEEDGFRADSSSATYTLNFNAPENSEIYVQIKGLNIDEVKQQSMSMSYSSNIAKGTIWATYSRDKYRLEHYEDFLIYLGNTSNGKIKQFKLTFPREGKYYFEDISVYSVSRKDTASKYEAMCANSLQNTVIGVDKIESDLSSTQRGVLMIAIPYNANWEIKVDGHAAKTFVVDYMWTGVWVEAGQHHITMTYNNELLKTGIYLTISGIIFTGAIAIIQRRKRNVR